MRLDQNSSPGIHQGNHDLPSEPPQRHPDSTNRNCSIRWYFFCVCCYECSIITVVAESIRQHTLRNANTILGTHLVRPDHILTTSTTTARSLLVTTNSHFSKIIPTTARNVYSHLNKLISTTTTTVPSTTTMKSKWRMVVVVVDRNLVVGYFRVTLLNK